MTATNSIQICIVAAAAADVVVVAAVFCVLWLYNIAFPDLFCHFTTILEYFYNYYFA